jgi:hypothetical protein
MLIEALSITIQTFLFKSISSFYIKEVISNGSEPQAAIGV